MHTCVIRSNRHFVHPCPASGIFGIAVFRTRSASRLQHRLIANQTGSASRRALQTRISMTFFIPSSRYLCSDLKKCSPRHERPRSTNQHLLAFTKQTPSTPISTTPPPPRSFLTHNVGNEGKKRFRSFEGVGLVGDLRVALKPRRRTLHRARIRRGGASIDLTRWRFWCLAGTDVTTPGEGDACMCGGGGDGCLVGCVG